MKIISIVFLIFFILSVIGIAVFPSSAMVLCNTKSMCSMTIHQIDKALGFFNGTFSTSIYLILLVAVFSFVFFVLPFFLEFANLYLKRKLLKSPHSIFLDYIKKALSEGIIEPQLYY